METFRKLCFLRESFFFVIVTVYLKLVNSQMPGPAYKYDLSTGDTGEFCKLIQGFEFSMSGGVARTRNNVCYKYAWVPDPCTMEKSGRLESDMLHCGHYEMKRCDGKDGKEHRLPDEYDLEFEEMAGLCDNVIELKDQTTKKLPNLPCKYWKWTYCATGRGTEDRPCGRYSMEECLAEPPPEKLPVSALGRPLG